MKTIVVVDGQKLSWYGKPPELADNSIQFVQFQFNLSEDWAELEVVAQFTQDQTYNKLLENGCCYLPAELVAGMCDLSLFGQKAGQVVRATTIPLRFKIHKSGFTSTAETPIPPTPDLYAQLLEKLGQGGSGGGSGSAYVASEEPPEDTRALWVNTAELEEAVALGVTAVETAEGVDMYCTDELGTTKVSLRHGKDGAPGEPGAPGDDYVLTDDDVQEIAGAVLAALPVWTGGAY